MAAWLVRLCDFGEPGRAEVPSTHADAIHALDDTRLRSDTLGHGRELALGHEFSEHRRFIFGVPGSGLTLGVVHLAIKHKRIIAVDANHSVFYRGLDRCWI